MNAGLTASEIKTFEDLLTKANQKQILLLVYMANEHIRLREERGLMQNE